MTENRLEIGVNVNTRVPIIYPKEYTAADLVSLGERVEDLGFDSVWVGDNFFAKSRLESTTTLAAIAGRTSRARLGTAAFILTLRHTVWLAITWATLDQISKGRTILNVCVGGGGKKLAGSEFDAEFRVAGVPYDRRGRVLEEQIALIRHIWSGAEEPFSGAFHEIPAVSIDPRPANPRLPIWIANNPHLVDGIRPVLVDRMLDRVGRLADGWMTALASPEEFRSLWRKVVDAAEKVGRGAGAIRPAYQMTLTVADDRKAAENEALDYLNRYYGSSHTKIADSMWHRDPFGTPEDCLDKIRGLAQAGVRSFTLRFASRDQRGQVERFARDVLPKLRT